MRDKKSLQQQLNEMRNKDKWLEVETEDTPEVSLEPASSIKKEPEKEEDILYTFEELKESLLDKQGLKDIVSDFADSQDYYDPHKVYICSIPKGHPAEEPSGQYIGFSTGLVKDKEEYSHLQGEMPRALYDTAHAIRPIVRLENSSLEYTQAELIEDIKDSSNINQVDDGKLTLLSGEEVDYLTIVNRKYFEKAIDEVLERYDKLTDSDSLLKEYSKLREMVGKDKMIYCPLLNKCITVIS